MSARTTPVVLFIYNRPELTRRMIDTLRAVQPERVLIAADGPDPHAIGDRDRCAAARAATRAIDWPCEVSENFAAGHLGLGKRVTSGIEWAFEQAAEAIFLEDDCLPDPSFFPFCQELLAKYRDVKDITMICGSNPLGQWRAGQQSYHFSLHGSHWGWAGWRRSWQGYDFEMKGWSDPETARRLLDISGSPAYTAHWLQLCRLVEERTIDTWDIQWSLGMLLQGKRAVVPAFNLISNSGIGPAGTHTRSTLALSSRIGRHELPFPLVEPLNNEADLAYDRRIIAWRLGQPDLAFVLARAADHMAAGQPFKALALVEAVLQGGAEELATVRARFLLAKAEALLALGRENLAVETAKSGLSDSSLAGQPAGVRSKLQEICGDCGPYLAAANSHE